MKFTFTTLLFLVALLCGLWTWLLVAPKTPVLSVDGTATQSYIYTAGPLPAVLSAFILLMPSLPSFRVSSSFNPLTPPRRPPRLPFIPLQTTLIYMIVT
jgi:hypothetical protein